MSKIATSLPAVRVYGTRPMDPFYGLGTPPHGNAMGPRPGFPTNPINAFTSSIANGHNVMNMAMTGDNINTLDAFFKGLSGRNAAYLEVQIRLLGTFTPWLMQGGYKGLADANPYGFTLAQAVHVPQLVGVYVQYPRTILPTSIPDFYGSVFMPIAAIYYWVKGGGKTRYVNIESLGLRMGPADLPIITNFVKNRAHGPGSYPISGKTSYNVFNHASDIAAAGVFGRISLNVQGTVTIHPDHTWSFAGKYSINPDRYDADVSRRTFTQEALTTFLRGIGDTLGHTDYMIEVRGEAPLNGSGRR